MPSDENPFAGDLPDWLGEKAAPAVTKHPATGQVSADPAPATPPVAAINAPVIQRQQENPTEDSAGAAANVSAEVKANRPPKPVRRIYNDPREEWGAVYHDEEDDEPEMNEDGADNESAVTDADTKPGELSAQSATVTQSDTPESSDRRPEGDAPLASESAPATHRRPGSRNLVITMRRTGDVSRDKYRLREIYELVRDPRGRGKDAFFIRLYGVGGNAELSFPNDRCEINDKLLTDLQKRMRLGVEVITPQ